MRRRTQLAKVKNPRGRIDVAAYRIAERVMEGMERERGLVGLRERLLPIVENAIVETIPRRIQPELFAILQACFENSRRIQ